LIEINHINQGFVVREPDDVNLYVKN
jgi:hypothetical protein